jgi:hypothetical protein
MSGYVRRPGNRVPRKSVLVVCGGEETEPNYFQCLARELRLSTVEVVVRGKGYDPMALVDYALQENKPKRSSSIAPPCDEVWVVFDVEAAERPPRLEAAVDRARQKRLNLAVSNPSFEYWFLLHFKDTARPFTNATELIKELKQHIPQYEKNTPVFPFLSDHTQVAVKRAKRILRNASELGEDFPNPSTGVHTLVEELIKLSEFR